MINLTNGVLNVQIALRGAELQSVKCRGEEFLWQGDPSVWASRAPLLFPICGGLKDDVYRWEGKTYTIQKHGFVRFEEFEPEEVGTDHATLLLRSNEHSRQNYPFDWELRVGYSLQGETLQIEYSVTNLSSGVMPFSIGSHEGYLCPGGVEQYDVIFERDETLKSSVVNGNLLEPATITVTEQSGHLRLINRYFSVDALVFKTMESRSAVLRNRETGREVRLDYPDFPSFLIWTKPDAPMVCLEPWYGIPDPVDASGEFLEKEGLCMLQPGKTANFRHSITYIRP